MNPTQTYTQLNIFKSQKGVGGSGEEQLRKTFILWSPQECIHNTHVHKHAHSTYRRWARESEVVVVNRVASQNEKEGFR